MQDFENNKSVQDAINTLEGAAGTAQDQADYAARKAQEYARAQAEANGIQQPRFSKAAAFNANGDPTDENVVSEDDMEDDDDTDYTQDDCDTVEATPVGDDAAAIISDLQGQIEILKQTVASEHDKMIRAVAEADNIRKRAAQDIERERKYALEKFVNSLMPVYDALEKALEYSDRNNEATKATLDGVENTLALFLKEMQSFGVDQVDPTGQPFDPNFHQAVSMVPSADVPNNHVLSTMQKGFTLNGRVVRPAMVVVAKNG